MSPPTNGSVAPMNRASSIPRVLVATTALLSFISFWRAAAIVLNDLASSAYYAGGEAEGYIGKAAPWFILGIMLFSYAVRAVYVESCSMFVRGGVYRAVKQALGGTLAKFSVSALMFDYVLTGPISGVAAGQYLAGLVNELFGYFHLHLHLAPGLSSATFAIGVTLYFWWQNIKGIPESSHKAMRIMQVTTVMVVILIGWCSYTAWIRHAPLPPLPRPQNLKLGPNAMGWLYGFHFIHFAGLLAVLIGLGHSVLAMSGEESLAQVYREIEHPKLPNLRKTGLVIFIYSLVFTSLVSFFAVMIIPDTDRQNYLQNLIGGLAMNLQGPLFARLIFHGFVVVVGTMILAGTVITAIVGSNGVLNRVSEDGVLADWFRRPHPRFGTSHRIINLVVGLQLFTILLSRGDVNLLGQAYAFGVMWSFATKGLAVLVLRFTEPGPRDFRVPLNLRLGPYEIPLGLIFITLTLFATAGINLFTKQIATISGVAFTIIFFAIFTASERISQKRGAAHAELDQFHLQSAEEISPAVLGVRPGNVAVMVRDYNTLYNLAEVLKRANPERQDVVVLHIRVLRRGGAGEHDLAPEQLFTFKEQELFTRALNLAEKNGKTVHLAVFAATDVWDGILRAAQALQSSMVVLGLSPRVPADEEARLAGLAWERLPS